MTQRLPLLTLLAVASLGAGACTTAVIGAPDRGYGHGERHDYYGPAHIPPGHLPPPGECRIWYPGEPPGHQPPPGNCAELSHRVPLGAWLIERPRHYPGEAHVSFYDTVRVGVVLGISIYDADSGRRLDRRPEKGPGGAKRTRPPD